MKLRLPSFVQTKNRHYFHRRTVNLLSIVLGTTFCLSAIYSGVGVARADSVTSTIPVGQDPRSIAYDSANGNLYVTNFVDNTVSVISGATNTVIGNPIPVGREPWAIAFDSANGNLYVVNYGDNTVSVISGVTNQVIGHTIGVGSGPAHITFDPANGNLYESNLNDVPGTVYVISGVSNTVIAGPILVGNAPEGIAFNPSNSNLYVANLGDETLSVISGQTNMVVGNPILIGGAAEPFEIAFVPDNGNFYVTDNGANSVSVISGQTNTVFGNPIQLVSGPLDIQTWGIAFNPANGNLYVGNSAGNNASIISDHSNTVIGTIPIAGTMGVAYDSANGNIYFTTTDSHVAVVSTVPQAPPQTAITAVGGNNAPVINGGTTSSNSIKFTFTTTGGLAPYSYTCILQTPFSNGLPSPCSSGVSFNNLPPAFIQLFVSTVDANGEKSQNLASFTWHITTPPSLTPIQATQQLIQLKHSMHLASATDQALDSQLNAAIQSFQHNVKLGGCGHLIGFATVVPNILTSR